MGGVVEAVVVEGGAVVCVVVEGGIVVAVSVGGEVVVARTVVFEAVVLSLVWFLDGWGCLAQEFQWDCKNNFGRWGKLLAEL